jgi:PAS domain S-box-containing protein
MVDVADLTPKSTLAQMESRYRGLLEAAPDAMVVVNGAGEIVLLNLQAEKQFGYPRDELLGQAGHQHHPTGFAERIIADDLRSAADALAQQIGTGIELVALRKDGTEFPIELMLSPLEGSDGILVTAAIRDISVRKAAESTWPRWRAAIAVCSKPLPDAMVVVNGAGEIVLLNLQAEKQFGYHRDELVGQQVTNIIPPASPSGSSPTICAPRPMPWPSRSGPASSLWPCARTTRSWGSSPTSPRTTCRSRCGWWPATRSFSPGATRASWTPMPTSSSPSQSTGPAGCSG